MELNAVNAFIQDKGDLFKNCSLGGSSFSVVDCPPQWKGTDFAILAENPGFLFYTYPSKMLIRDYQSGVTPIQPQQYDAKLFNFDNPENEALLSKSFQEKLGLSPPLASVYQNKPPAPLLDKRVDVGKLSPGELRYFTVEIGELTSPCEIICPVVVNCFLFDADSKERISETWRILPKSMHGLPSAEMVSKYIQDAPTSVSFPISTPSSETQIHRIVFVVSLDRIFIKNGGESLDKYLAKPKDSTKKDAMVDIKKCNQAETLQTFGWCCIPFSELVPRADTKTVLMNNFLPIQTLCYEGIAKEVDSGFGKSKGKALPFSVSFKVSANDNGAPKLQHFFNFQHALPSMAFQNTLYINLKKTKFRFPRSIRGRNIIVHIQILSNSKAISCFHGKEKYVSRTQYHEENPTFYDEAVADLPLDLPTDAEIKFTFWHASVKSGTSIPVEKCGYSSFPLFNNGTFIADGPHDQYVIYSSEPADTSEGNRVYFETNLFSSAFTSDPQISKIFHGDLKADAPNLKLLLPHIYTVLDALLAGIEDDNPNAFGTLLNVISLFDKTRNSPQNHTLLFYIKYAAFRGKTNEFYKNCSKYWLKYIQDNKQKLMRPDIVNAWFLFELIIKSLVITKTKHYLDDIVLICQELSAKLSEFRSKQVTTGNTLNITLTLFFKDIIEASSREVGFLMISNHLKYLQLMVQRFDRECFRDVIANLFTPKNFLFFLTQFENTENTHFDQYFIPPIEEAFRVEQHTSMIFNLLFTILSQFNSQQHNYIHTKLGNLLDVIERNIEVIQEYTHRTNHVYIFAIVHYVFSYLPKTQAEYDERWTKKVFKERWSKLAYVMLTNMVHLKGEPRAQIIKEFEGPSNSFEDLTKKVLVDVNEEANQLKVAGSRKFASLKQSRKAEVIAKPTERIEITKIFDALAFGAQSVFINAIDYFDGPYIVNNIIVTYFDIQISPYLEAELYEHIALFVESRPETFFCGEKTQCKHIIRKIIQNPNFMNVKLLERIGQAEKKKFGSDLRTKAFIARALFKCPQTSESIELLKSTSYGSYAESIFIIDSNLTPQRKIDNPDIYSDLLFQKFSLLEPSPDARIEVLMQLQEHQSATNYKSEALMSLLCSAALISEYMLHFKRIPYVFFNTNHPALKFANACPPAVTMIVPDEQISKLPDIPGYCTSKYFSEFGLIYLIQVSMELAKAAGLYELSNRVHSLLSPIAQHRHLWRVLQKHYMTGQFIWLISAKMYTSSDRRLGSYYKVEFPDQGVYIYRETELVNLWQVCSKLTKSSVFYSNGKEVVVVSEGQELDKKKYSDPDKYYVHVKFLNQYFTANERKNRMTVFEQNHNITQFYFDVPFSRNSQSGLEHCSLKRTIFTLPYPLPYLINRVHVPPENIQKIVFEPIEYAIQNLQLQVSKINESCARVHSEMQNMKENADGSEVQSFKELQPLIQGSLLVQVNEGPEKMAAVFLNGDEKPHQAELRAVFRDFILANTAAVKIHGKMVLKFPIYAVLQEELELGLSKLTSKLQQYLK